MHPKLFYIQFAEFLSKLPEANSLTKYNDAFYIGLGTVSCLYIKRVTKIELNNLISFNSVFYTMLIAIIALLTGYFLFNKVRTNTTPLIKTNNLQ
jgi:hypothetical protein